eukprot:TRINITY_DN11158_c0_g1_i1.p1 TRINITY_DN11158_c0_g1~~TRINITY_DN11158_c0_g1_i1.p1  ORF type:complete len:200 (-),score=35.21 TRINITY_DN11158_c0_g1_i1:110-709(-)
MKLILLISLLLISLAKAQESPCDTEGIDQTLPICYLRDLEPQTNYLYLEEVLSDDYLSQFTENLDAYLSTSLSDRENALFILANALYLYSQGLDTVTIYLVNSDGEVIVDTSSVATGPVDDSQIQWDLTKRLLAKLDNFGCYLSVVQAYFCDSRDGWQTLLDENGDYRAYYARRITVGGAPYSNFVLVASSPLNPLNES